MRDIWIKALLGFGFTLIVGGLFLTPSNSLMADAGIVTPKLCRDSCSNCGETSVPDPANPGQRKCPGVGGAAPTCTKTGADCNGCTGACEAYTSIYHDVDPDTGSVVTIVQHLCGCKV